ncbi:MAG: NUDIX hydrolase [Methanosarcina sp.]|nr:NUDIX hydrolase [Methanosarcina sp.]
MESLYIVLSEVSEHKNGITRDELAALLVHDVNTHKLDSYLQSLEWAYCIRTDGIKYYCTIDERSLELMLQEQSINMSAGTLIINPLNEVLIVHPTLQEKYDIPKGGADPSDADLVETAARELFEETGLKVDKQFFNSLGIVKATKYKQVALFVIVGLTVDLEKCVCSTTFTGPNNEELPEVDRFELAHISQLSKCLPEPFGTNVLNAVMTCVKKS